MSKLRVLVVADCESLRRSLVLLLARSNDLAGAVPSDRMMDAVYEVKPQIIVCSVRTPLIDQQTRSILKSPDHNARFVFVTTLTLDVQDWIDHGNVCVVNETDLHQDLTAAVQAAANGEIYLSRHAVRI